MALYRWKIPMLKALQFNGKNNKEIKALLGDESENEEPSIGTGRFEEPPKVEKGHGHDKKEAEAPKTPVAPPKEVREKLKLKEGDWVTVDPITGKVEINPKDFPDKFEYIG